MCLPRFFLCSLPSLVSSEAGGLFVRPDCAALADGPAPSGGRRESPPFDLSFLSTSNGTWDICGLESASERIRAHARAAGYLERTRSASSPRARAAYLLQKSLLLVLLRRAALIAVRAAALDTTTARTLPIVPIIVRRRIRRRIEHSALGLSTHAYDTLPSLPLTVGCYPARAPPLWLCSAECSCHGRPGGAIWMC